MSAVFISYTHKEEEEAKEKLTEKAAMAIMVTFKAVNSILRTPLRHCPPRLRWSHNMPLNPSENQDMNSALMSPRSSLKIGIASASTQATTQHPVTTTAQLTYARRLLDVIVAALPLHAQNLTYTILAATCPFMTPATTMVGRAMP